MIYKKISQGMLYMYQTFSKMFVLNNKDRLQLNWTKNNRLFSTFSNRF